MNLKEEISFRVMRSLEENTNLTQRELAKKFGIGVGGLSYCLKTLMKKGLVKMRNFANSKSKFGNVCADPKWHGRKGHHDALVFRAQDGRVLCVEGENRGAKKRNASR